MRCSCDASLHNVVPVFENTFCIIRLLNLRWSAPDEAVIFCWTMIMRIGIKINWQLDMITKWCSSSRCHIVKKKLGVVLWVSNNLKWNAIDGFGVSNEDFCFRAGNVGYLKIINTKFDAGETCRRPAEPEVWPTISRIGAAPCAYVCVLEWLRLIGDRSWYGDRGLVRSFPSRSGDCQSI